MNERSVDAQAYWVMSPGVGELRREAVRIGGPEHVLVRAEYSGVSPGTERLVGLGRVPASCAERMAPRYMAGSFELPVKYGYDLVGIVDDGELAGRRVFVMHPHQSWASVRAVDVVPIPASLPPVRATLLPNLETALNAVWDAHLSGRERCVVVGGGVVGVLVAFVLRRESSDVDRVALIECDAARRADLAAFPWVDAVADGAQPFDIAFHATGCASGLQAAIDAVGFEGTVVDLSWYGDQPVTLDLGGTFHADRKRIVASQVGSVAPSHRATHGPAERLAKALDLLADDRLDALLSPPVAFDALPSLMREIYEGQTRGRSPVVDYRGMHRGD